MTPPDLAETVRQHSLQHAQHRNDLGQISKMFAAGGGGGVPKVLDLTPQQPSINLPPTNDGSLSICVVNLNSVLPIYVGMLGGQAIAGNGVEIAPRQWVVFPFSQNIGMDIAVQAAVAELIATLESETVEVMVITFKQPQAFASGKLSSPTAIVQVLQPPVPALGAEWSYTVPAGEWLRLLSGYAQFNAGAAVANRELGLTVLYPQLPPNQNVFQQIGLAQGAISVVANGAAVATYNKSGGWTNAGSIGNGIELGMPPLVLPPTAQIRSSTAGLQGGDQYSSLSLLVEVWYSSPALDREGAAP